MSHFRIVEVALFVREESELRPKVSVIVPVYNAEKYIDLCLSSLVNQSLKEIEIICINDGSTDNSLKILRKYERACQNVYVYSQEDLGQANAVNRGLRIAKGEYVAECDSDDFVSLSCYEDLYECAKKHNADVIKCGYVGLWTDGKLLPQYVAPEELCDKAMIPHNLPPKYRCTVFARVNNLWAGLYRRQFLLDNNIFWREGYNYEDTCVEFKVRLMAERYVFFNGCPYFYRQDNPNSGTSTIQDVYAICEQFDEMERFAKENGYDDFIPYVNSYRYYMYMWNYNRLKKMEDKEAFIKRAGEDFRTKTGERMYFNDDEDWMKYNAIRFCVWEEDLFKRE